MLRGFSPPFSVLFMVLCMQKICEVRNEGSYTLPKANIAPNLTEASV